MRSTLLAVCALAALLAGCAGDNSSDTDGDPTGGTAEKPAASVTDDGVYEVGVDIRPGVYLASGPACVGFTARTASYDLLSDERDADDFIAGSALVGDVLRISIHDGDFFTSHGCPEWTLEDPDGARTPDPATRAGACQILIGDDHLVDQVLAVGDLPASQQEPEDVGGLQEHLMTVVFARAPRLWAPVGELVDFLDDPAAFVNDDGELEQRITRKADAIRSVCTP